jgi:hypothetical protein
MSCHPWIHTSSCCLGVVAQDIQPTLSSFFFFFSLPGSQQAWCGRTLLWREQAWEINGAGEDYVMLERDGCGLCGALAEWLTRCPAKAVPFGSVCSNHTGIGFCHYFVIPLGIKDLFRCLCTEGTSSPLISAWVTHLSEVMLRHGSSRSCMVRLAECGLEG